MSARFGSPTRSVGRRSAAVTWLAALAIVAALAAPSAAQLPRRYLGMPLVEALARLQEQGLRIIYSSDLVHPDMKVAKEPTGTWLHDVLAQLLEPHGLAVRVGPGGSLLVVRAGPPPVTVRLTSPVAGEVTTGEVDVTADVDTTEPVAFVDFFVNGWPAARVKQPPWSARIPVPDEGGSCRFTVVARTTGGGRASDSVITRRVVHEDRVEVALRQVFVTASYERGRGGSPELGVGDFHVYDQGVAQPLATFGRGDAPISALLLIDASESMRGAELQAAFDAARQFLKKLSPEDEAAVMVFADRVLTLTPFGPPEPGLLEGIDNTAASGGTALDDHLYAALRLLDERPGRRIVVLLSDGADVTSTLTAADLRWKVERSDASIYWLRLDRARGERSFASAWRDVAGNDREFQELGEVVEDSGGRIEPLLPGVDLGRAFTAVMAELRAQYVLGYYPRDLKRDGSWRSLEVRAAPGVRLRYRAGWVDR
ncbi:MAG TPA: VWA domain-containing protein [Thermoanaerobaculia bacterium]|jgi:Ca-activated chloride channel family protein|nr:VWA domain-containing protein [Thermoanaerobaculia bacterium]